MTPRIANTSREAQAESEFARRATLSTGCTNMGRRIAAGSGARTRAHSDDASRAVSPLVIAADAYVIDTSHVTIEQVVNEILKQLEEKGLPGSDVPITNARAR